MARIIAGRGTLLERTHAVLNDFPSDIVDHTAHRPWPIPDAPWLMTQSWHDLLFAHWPVDRKELQAKLPAAFALDVFEEQAWIGIVPFRMTNVGPRGVPALPLVSAFAELNVRTYVTVAGRPGVYFFSLDADSTIAVATARSLLHLPYYTAEMHVRANPAGQIHYTSRRTEHDAAAAELNTSYAAVGAAFEAQPGTLEYFLTERYALYNVDRRSRPYRLDIHHLPWKLHAATASFERNTMAAAAGIRLPDVVPTLHFSRRQDMVAWPPAILESGTRD